MSWEWRVCCVLCRVRLGVACVLCAVQNETGSGVCVVCCAE
jgi:hypothetical protein